ncbi:hypothetical protein CEK26_003492 [Fusarium fujikuroi]|nr:hypothetical protein CEK27_003484 [Fusarium fujikuroi]QGJ02048.1 hypothetical protein CEK26_003492 [Fusarium fujikuroi]
MAIDLDPTYLTFCSHSLIEMYNWERHEFPSSKDIRRYANESLERSPLDREVPTDWVVEHNFKPINPKTLKLNAKYNPAQHIYRTITKEWEDKAVPNDQKSKFNVNLNSAWEHTSPDPARLPILGASDGVFYWNHYDLLGFILSLLKTDLEGAKKDNFFLPLTAVYGRWCAKIGGDRKTPDPPKSPKDTVFTGMADEQIGVGPVPTVFQCTWIKDKGVVYFALGSSIAGHNVNWSNKSEVGVWKEKLQRTRFDLLYNWNDIHTERIDGKEWDFENSPTLNKSKRTGTHFGNCGETYPFLHILRLADLYKYELEDIYEFLRDVAQDPDSFKIDEAESKKEKLQTIYKQILTLCPLDKNDIQVVKDDVTAENYEPRIGDRIKGEIDQKLQPSQHIYRQSTVVMKTDGNKKTWSPIEVKYDNDWSHAYPPRVGNGSLPYWSHYDLLGLFLSLMGPAQPNSDRFRFFLPLTAVYARWAFTIGGNRKKKSLKSSQVMAFKPRPGYGKPPTIFQCTWITGPDSYVDFSLGASMGGQNYGSINKETGDNSLGNWSERLQRSRFGLLKGWNAIEDSEWTNQNGELERFAFETSPSIDSGLSTTKFGNCGETYPFVQMLATGREEMKGLALNSPFLGDKELWEDYSLANIHIEAAKKRQDEEISFKWIWSPCRNCKHLIKVASAELDNFLPERNPPTEKDFEEAQTRTPAKENGHLVSA